MLLLVARAVLVVVDVECLSLSSLSSFSFECGWFAGPGRTAGEPTWMDGMMSSVWQLRCTGTTPSPVAPSTRSIDPIETTAGWRRIGWSVPGFPWVAIFTFPSRKYRHPTTDGTYML
uniref:Putative secreted protein n=1 Tax=Anopheles darlingi TaxID=43151 RepID=A0A2M4DJM2_ANODA